MGNSKYEDHDMTEVRNSSSKNRVMKFFDNEVRLYILNDIETLNSIEDTGLGNCAVPHAMMLFAVIDLFGYLTREDEDPKKTDTLGNFRYFLSEKANFFPKEYVENYEKIVKLFRHGLIHQFFPKASGICRAGTQDLLIFENQGSYNLNVDVLSRDVVAALEKVRQYCSETHNNELPERINSRLDRLAREDYETIYSLRNQMPNQ
jgi:hypothetical protein